MLNKCTLWLSLCLLIPGLAQAENTTTGTFDPSQRLTALFLKDADPLTREAVLDDVERAGGHVVHVLPWGLMLAELPARERLLFHSPGVELVSTEKVNLTSAAPSQSAAIRAWNRLLDPPVEQTGEIERYPGSCTEGTESMQKDAPLEHTSAFMIGRIVVSILYPYCEDSEECTVSPYSQSELVAILARTVEAMDWWASQEPDANLTFYYEPVKSVAISREPDVDCPAAPISCGQFDDLFRGETLTALGYPGMDPFDQERSYIDDLRHGRQPATLRGWDADWAFILYVPKQTNSKRSYAKDGGPYEVVWDGYPAAEIAHETGHVFRAKDEYGAIWSWEQCSVVPFCRSCYLGRVITGSGMHDFVDEFSIMRSSGSMVGVSSYSRAALGWRNSDATHAGWSDEHLLDSGTPYTDIISEDFDANSTVDLAAITATSPSTVTVWTNDGDGNFHHEADIALRSQATSLVWNWNLRSLLVAEIGGPIRALKRVDGSWLEEEAWNIEADARALAWLDIDFDDREDLVVALDGGGITAFTPDLNLGTWVRIDAPTTTAVCDAIDMGDFNEDTFPDLVAATTSGLYLWRSDDEGNWSLSDHLLGDFWLRDVWATDLNGDHHFDLVVNLLRGGVRMYEGDGHGTLSTFPQPSTGDGQRIWLADVDHNLTLDLVIGTWNPPGVEVWLNVDEAGQWNLGLGSEENARIGQIAVADFDSDGFMDIAGTSAHERLVGVRFNKGLTGDHVLDPVDTVPGISSLSQTDCRHFTVTMEGTARDIPLPTGYGTTDITINTVADVEYRLPGGSWLPATPVDGAFDQENEAFEFDFTGFVWGTVEVRARNSVGNLTPIPASDTFFCLPW